MKKLTPWMFAAGSGAALALALPGPGWTPLILLFPGLMLEALERTRPGLRPWLLGWFAGIVHWIISVNWVLPVMHHYGGLPLVVAGFCLVAMAVILGSCWALAAGLTSMVASRWRVWLFPTAWVAVDVVRRFWPLEFPWHPPAAAFADHPVMLRSLPIWGATGLGWGVMIIGAGLWAVRFPRGRRIGLTAVGGAAALLLIFSLVAPDFSAGDRSIAVAVIQPGTSLEEKWDPEQWREMERRVWELTRSAVEHGAEVVLWPESALPFRADTDPTYRQMLAGLADDLTVTIVLNSIAGSEETGFTNSAFVVRPDGMIPERYDKMRLVPFGEYVPSWARFAFTDALIREVGNFTPGDSPRLLDVGVPLGMAVCYEVVFADLIASEVRNGAELLATLTNDGWYGYSWAPHQHFAHVVLRAVENRRWMSRSALTGISGFVAPDGRVVSRLEVGDQGYLIHDLWPSRRLTLRTRMGDWWAVLCWVAVAVLAVAGRAAARRERGFLVP